MTLISTLCCCFQVAYQGIEIVDSLEKTISNSNQTSILSKGILFSKISQLAFQCLEIGSSSVSTKYFYKNLEVFIGLITTPLQCAEENFLAELNADNGTLSWVEYIRVLEKKAVFAARILRRGAELNALRQRMYIEMTPEERDNTKIPIYESVGGDRKIVGYKPIIKEESEGNLEKYTAKTDLYYVAENALTLGVVTNIAEQFENIYDRHVNPSQDDALNNVEENDDLFNFTGLEKIPSEFHNDVVFSRYVCPISFSPIRYPLGDPNNRTIYERSEIIQWINQNGTSPITREPLSVFQLVAKPALQALIDHRLTYHTERLREYARNQNDLQQPAHGCFQIDANNENPAL